MGSAVGGWLLAGEGNAGAFVDASAVGGLVIFGVAGGT